MVRPLLSPLRYPGSKRRLAEYIKKTVELNGLRPELYVEPFVGGASVALQLLDNKLVEKAVLVDVDPWVASFWITAFYDAEWLVERIQTADVTVAHWEAIKRSDPQTVREQAWACLFLNRTSFSGILRHTAGPLGGKQQKSVYKIDCRFPRNTLIDRIRRVAALRDKIAGIWCTSWDQGINRIRTEQRQGRLPTNNLFFYFDPPFFFKAEKLYRFHFTCADHRRLREALLRLSDNWILSYDSADQVETLYGPDLELAANGTKKHSIELLYSVSMVQGRKKGKEVILSNMERLPSFDNVAN